MMIMRNPRYRCRRRATISTRVIMRRHCMYLRRCGSAQPDGIILRRWRTRVRAIRQTRSIMQNRRLSWNLAIRSTAIIWTSYSTAETGTKILDRDTGMADRGRVSGVFVSNSGFCKFYVIVSADVGCNKNLKKI